VASETLRAIEAIVMVADAPVEPRLLAQLLEVSPGRIEECCAELEAAYREEDRGFELVRVAGGYRFQSHADLAPYVERYILEGQTARLSAAALETLAIVAYKQPVSRAQIAAVRGVSVDGVIRTLHAHGFVKEVGRDPGPGQAVLYGTTPLLLERLGLDRIEALPSLAQFVPGPEIMESLEHSLRAERRANRGSGDLEDAGDLADAGDLEGAGATGEGADGGGDRVDAPGPDQAGPDQAGPDQAGPDQAGPDQAGPDQAAQPQPPDR
jgi:segregation and condensation protein B